MPKDSELIRSVLIPMNRAASRSISTARMALPVRVWRRNQKTATEARMLPIELTTLGALRTMPERCQVPENSVCPMER